MKTLTTVLLTSFTLAFTACNESQTTEEHNNVQPTAQEVAIAKDVSVKEFKQLIEKGDGVLIDVRTPTEFNNGFIKGAKNINIAANFETAIETLDKNQPVYVYCAAGGRSSRAMKTMHKKGFKAVYNLKGGYGAWTSH